MPMRLARVSIKNFRSIPPSGIDLSFRTNLIVLVGKNNSGKSNIHEAIRIILGPKHPRYAPIGLDDFHDPREPIVIEAEFSGLNFGDGKSIGLSDGQCHALTKAGKDKVPGHITFQLTVPPPDEGDLEETDEDHEEEDSPKRTTFQYLLANHQPYQRTEPVRAALVRHMFVPAVRNQSDFLTPSNWTSYGSLLRDILDASEGTDKLKQIIAEATVHLRNILSSEASALTETAKTTAYVDAIGFQLTRESDPAELLKVLTLTVAYGGRVDDISRVGTGTQSAVIIGILEMCLRYRAKRGLRIFGVEEPELYLHPQAQRHIASMLQKITLEEGSQIVLSTHSAALLGGIDILDVIRTDRGATGQTQCHRVSEQTPGLNKALRILKSDTNEMVFADRAVLVEGPSEALLLPAVAKLVSQADGKHTCDLDRLNISVVPVRGKKEFPTYTALLDQLGIGWRIVTDLDALEGRTLDSFWKLAGIDDKADVEQQRTKLRRVGVVVLKLGDIEDYYPAEALATLAGCATADVPKHIEVNRDMPGKAEIDAIVLEMIAEHVTEIGGLSPEELALKLGPWKKQAEKVLREQGRISPKTRKTGDAIAAWLGYSGKPALAQEVASYLTAHPEHIPQSFKSLVHWLVSK